MWNPPSVALSTQQLVYFTYDVINDAWLRHILQRRSAFLVLDAGFNISDAGRARVKSPHRQL